MFLMSNYRIVLLNQSSEGCKGDFFQKQTYRAYKLAKGKKVERNLNG